MLNQLYTLSRSLGLQVLLEIHNQDELERVLPIKPDIIGINNRNLRTFDVNLETSFQLRKQIPDSIFTISESGIQSREHVERLQDHGFSGILVGEFLIKHQNIGAALRELTDDKN
jgi:indole-3-glycerol phosphate synthase